MIPFCQPQVGKFTSRLCGGAHSHSFTVGGTSGHREQSCFRDRRQSVWFKSWLVASKLGAGNKKFRCDVKPQKMTNKTPGPSVCFSGHFWKVSMGGGRDACCHRGWEPQTQDSEGALFKSDLWLCTSWPKYLAALHFFCLLFLIRGLFCSTLTLFRC